MWAAVVAAWHTLEHPEAVAGRLGNVLEPWRPGGARKLSLGHHGDILGASEATVKRFGASNGGKTRHSILYIDFGSILIHGHHGKFNAN